MTVIGLDHVQIAIPEGGEDRAREFFGDILGMSEVPKPANLSPSGCWFESGSASIHIGVDPDFRPAHKAHPALLVSDLIKVEQKLVASACPVLRDKPVEGHDRLFTEDPFGNRIEIMQHTVS